MGSELTTDTRYGPRLPEVDVYAHLCKHLYTYVLTQVHDMSMPLPIQTSMPHAHEHTHTTPTRLSAYMSMRLFSTYAHVRTAMAYRLCRSRRVLIGMDKARATRGRCGPHLFTSRDESYLYRALEAAQLFIAQR